ncbi:MAG: sulfatase [Hyphomonas sp.]
MVENGNLKGGGTMVEMGKKQLRILVFTLLAVLCCAPAQAERLPNIVLLIGDDHGYPYFGFMGDRNVVTPTMDALAAGGATFTQGHVTAPYCSPSLRTLMTGLHPVQYSQRANAIVAERRKGDPTYASLSDKARRMWNRVQRAAAMREFETLPKLLKPKGYVSWQGGKWWENSYANGHFDEGMTKGWDMSLFGTDDFFHEMMGGEGTELGRTTMQPVFDFIDRHKDRPFFIWYGPALPHSPFDAPYEFTRLYADKDLSDSAKLYYSNITWWDTGVGRLMNHLEQAELLDNTLFIYISDNGWEQDAQVEYKKPGSTTRNDTIFANGGLKGKSGLYDQSFRTPIIFYWKNRIHATLNTTSLVSSLDIVPTILDLVGIDAPGGLRGYSLKPLLEGRDLTERKEIVGYTDQRRSDIDPMGERAEGYYVRTSRWHFLWYKDTNEMALYDITVDPKAERDLAAAYPDLVRSFQDKIIDWKKDIGMTEPTRIAN